MPPLLALPFPAIDPVAVAIGPITIKWYALSYIAGLLGGWFYARRLVATDRLWGAGRRPSLNDIDDLIVWVALGVVLGGRIGYVLFYNLPMYIADPMEILALRNGGMSFHGGFIGAILAFLLFGVMAVAVRIFGFRKPGLLSGVFVLGYALARTFCEFFREPDRQLGYLFGTEGWPTGGITMGMLLCLPMALVGLVTIVLAARGGIARTNRADAP